MIRAFTFWIGCHGGQTNVETAAHGRTLGHHQAVVTATEAQAKGRTPSDPQPKRVDRYSLCAQDRHTLGGPAPRNGLWLRDDLLASFARLGGGGRVGRITLGAAQRTQRCRRDRLVTGSRRQRLSARRFWGAKTGPSPVDRRKNGSKHHTITDANGVPLAVCVTAANKNDITQLLPLVDAIPAIAGKPGRPRKRPDAVQGDRGYDSNLHRRALESRRIEPILARRYTEHGSGLGVTRWVVERTLSWLHQFRRLRVRYERRSDIHEAFLKIGCCLICSRIIENRFC